MRKTLQWLFFAYAAIGSLTPLTAQTNPTAVSLPFSLTSQSSSTLPAGVALHRFSTPPVTRTVSPGTADLALAGSAPGGFTGGWYFLSDDGIGMLATGSTAPGALIVAINTSGLSNINISWVCKTILNQASRDNSIALQYRVGTTGNFTDLGTTSTYSSTGKVNGDVSATFIETLPATAENQPVVQVRWVYWESSSITGARDKISVDDISISSSVGSCAFPVVTASAVSDSSAIFTWPAIPSAVSYEYVLSTSSATPISGTTMTDTFYNATGLNFGTNYYFHIRSNCGSGNLSAWTTKTITTTTPLCDPPVATISGVNDSSATIIWNTIGSAVTYEYVLNTNPASPVSGTTTTDTTYSTTSLSPASTYYFHVRSNCDGGNNSGWVTDTIVTTGNSPEFTVMTYNLLNYPGSTGSAREPSYRTIVNAAQPDIVVVQELASGSGVVNFLNNVLNFSGSSYSAGTFIDGPDTDNGIFYKSSLFQFISNTAIATSLRNINQFKLRQISSGDTLIIYSVHLKASNTAPDEAQRAAEAATLRAVTNALPTGKNFMVCGDFNIYGSSEGAYQNLVQNGSNANGKFNDILSMSGTWNNSAYAINHTQSPRTTSFGGGATGGMDDRFDMFLFSNAIVQNGGFDIVSNSYKAFGNDGQHYNQALNTPPFTMYGSTVATAVHDASDHLPVIVKLKYSTPFMERASNTNLAETTDNKIIGNFLTVYPNPAHNQLFLKMNYSTTEPVDLYLYDLNGRKMKTILLNKQTAGTIIPIDVSDLPEGIFYFRAPALSGAYKIVQY
ncbi:MAG: endonuclease/exonuclease/phosphatase family protein [Taibaiella sp.]|jgi:endonuclease/exonuclease/phosphatase family metal-dependent hydrolase